ncbi:vitamin K epoxide reductase complex subunit 1-like [Xenia sp. Carnegie-2017]|uniref:vitamin K epoxide reductase complex subunit 1-like n=1 Tax=Xenia sp. Carnegie-2017 TaxID=2897299 RepID=UPI001F03C85A|nr:vitamin K epoxide reductase complex subunit 1-like [Xenia sp. Carnegie-2017]
MTSIYPKFYFVRDFRIFLCFIGVILSFYALYVELKKKNDKSFTALCDINSKMSCSKVFSSKYGTGFGLVEPLFGKDSMFNVPNSIYGITFYALIFILGFFNGKTIAWLSTASCGLSCIGCVYLAYILYFVLEDFCVVCVSTYAVNGFLLTLSIYHQIQLPENGRLHGD